MLQIANTLLVLHRGGFWQLSKVRTMQRAYGTALAWQRVQGVEDVQPLLLRDSPDFPLVPKLAPLPSMVDGHDGRATVGALAIRVAASSQARSWLPVSRRARMGAWAAPAIEVLPGDARGVLG